MFSSCADTGTGGRNRNERENVSDGGKFGEAFAQQSGIADLVEEDGKTYELQDVSYVATEKKYLGNVEKVTDSEVMAEGTAYEPPKRFVRETSPIH